MPPALGLFSITIVWPRGFDIDCAMTRATVSVGPGAKGTSNVIGCVGNCCAAALVAARTSASAIRGVLGMGILRWVESRPIIPSMNAVVDLRSDTVTRPSPGMRRAMHEAELGDDVFGDDPSVNRLQERAAELYGFEGAPF